ncbi:putative oxidoreductase [Paenarthrobacter nicotinovorans]|nr:putative oxidoreductase [Paenarthrobacter nicotinovorans]
MSTTSATPGDNTYFLSSAAAEVDKRQALARAEEAPGKGWHWGQEAHHLELPRGDRVNVGTVGPLEEVLFGPGHHTNGTSNLIGALRRSMATTGYSDLKEFQRVDVVVSPYLG